MERRGGKGYLIILPGYNVTEGRSKERKGKDKRNGEKKGSGKRETFDKMSNDRKKDK